jgi:hypothetical protein
MKTKLQSSTEFLFILAAIAALSISIVSVYVHFSHEQKQNYQNLLSAHSYNISPQIQQGESNLSAYAVLPNLTTVNKTTPGYLIVAGPGNITANVKVFSGQGVSEYPGQISKKLNQFGIIPFNIMPLNSGEKTLSLQFTLSSLNISITKNITEEFEAVSQGPQENHTENNFTSITALSGRISPDLEATGYRVSQDSPAYTITYWSHCTYHNWWTGNIEPENQQCGAGTWGFDTGDPTCNPYVWNGDDRYYCFAEQQNNENVGSIGEKPSYIYNITLYLYNSTVSMQAGLSSSSQTGSLLGKNNKTYGTVSVEKVFGQEAYPLPYSNYVVLYAGSTGKIINISKYSSYSATWSSLMQQFNAYNNTGGGNLGYAESLISALNNEQSAIESAPSINNSGCKLQNSSLLVVCNATEPLSFVINVTLNSTMFQNANQIIYMQGSEVNVG